MPDDRDIHAELETLRAEVAELRHWQATHVCTTQAMTYYAQTFTAAACAGGYAGQVWTVPVDKPLTVNYHANTAGAAPAVMPYIVNYAG